MRHVLPALALALLAFAPTGEADVTCDYNESQDVHVGTGYVHHTRHRCHWEHLGVQYTQSFERYDAHPYDPYSREGTSHAGALVLESLETRWPDGSRALVTQLRVERDGMTLGTLYQESEDAQGRRQCAASARGSGTPLGSASATTPPLPACWPRGLLFP